MRKMAKIGRNERCPCGSGLKYKKCHASAGGPPAGQAATAMPNLQHILEQMRASERIRQAQQGLGRPIVALKSGDRQIVAVGNRVYFSDKWKTFPDFLADYAKQKLGSDWGNAEIAKPLAERHPLMQWYDAYCKYQQATIKTPGEVCNANVTGIVACYLGLAYSLYLLDHNVEIQERLSVASRTPQTFRARSTSYSSQTSSSAPASNSRWRTKAMANRSIASLPLCRAKLARNTGSKRKWAPRLAFWERRISTVAAAEKFLDG
jgi:hypothetical protein